MSPTVFAFSIPTEHARVPAPIPIDVVTTDSRHYVRDAMMLEALRELDPEVARLLDVHEWPMCTQDGYAAACVLHAHGTPAIFINGEKRFDNCVPTVDELYEALLDEARTNWQRKTIESARARADDPRALAA